VLCGCGLSVSGHGGDFLQEGECHGGVFDIGLEDLIDFEFPRGGRRGLVRFWSGFGFGL